MSTLDFIDRLGGFVSTVSPCCTDLILAQVRFQLEQDTLQRLDRQVAQPCNELKLSTI